MKTVLSIITVLLLILSGSTLNAQYGVIRVNINGYRPGDVKTAVMIAGENFNFTKFSIVDYFTGKEVYSSDKTEKFDHVWGFENSFRLDFTEFTDAGTYCIKTPGGLSSQYFRIGENVYDGYADFLLNYMRQQRCGYNPVLDDSCHTHDGFVIYHGPLDSAHIDVTGGWHDASDYLQYVTTSANAAYQMLFAWEKNPGAFGDNYNANGRPGKNGIPDIIDEFKWGLDWLLKMNPSDDLMFNQIADDRDHQSFRLPTLDSVNYGKGLERPVYFASGKPQGVFRYQNRTTGIASTAAKYVTVYASAVRLLGGFFPEMLPELRRKAEVNYLKAVNSPGVCQTAPCRAPYFYEEENFYDDLELAAYQMYRLTGEKKYLEDAVRFGKEEPVTPWMGADTAKHYEWYPFVNMGHAGLAASEDPAIRDQFISFMRAGLEKLYVRSKKNPFRMGIPFIWCSNNLVAAALTQCRVYNDLTGDTRYLEMEAALRDWLFGCNPWGTSMIVGLPEWGDTPVDPHSALMAKYDIPIPGGLVDGPVYKTIFSRLIGITLYGGDEYAGIQPDFVVYHDDYGDYSTNEPTMDGTASLTYYLSSMQKPKTEKNEETVLGGTVRMDTTRKEVYLIFSGDEFGEGVETIEKTLRENSVKGAFFFTGGFAERYPGKVRLLAEAGHYIGPHSGRHLLYAPWEKRDSLLVTKAEFTQDLALNYRLLADAGADIGKQKVFLPPYEWYNDSISVWSSELGIKLINFTPGVRTNADYTIPSIGEKYHSSEKLEELLFQYEKKKGLNGALILIHAGTHPERTDKFYDRLGGIIEKLRQLGYSFGSF